jgi:hypothetical protein
MTEKKHVSVRLEQETRGKLELIAKRRMMATGVAVTLADLIREGLARFADSELAESSTAPSKPAPAEDQHDMFDQVAADKPVKASRTHTVEELTELRRQALECKSQGLSSYQTAEKLGVNQTMVVRKLWK